MILKEPELSLLGSEKYIGQKRESSASVSEKRDRLLLELDMTAASQRVVRLQWRSFNEAAATMSVKFASLDAFAPFEERSHLIVRG